MFKLLLELFVLGAGICALYLLVAQPSQREKAEQSEDRVAWQAHIADEAVVKKEPPPSTTEISEPPLFPNWNDRDRRRLSAIRARFSAGDFETALNMADETMEDRRYTEELHQWIVAQLPVLLTSAGWSKLKLGDCVAATHHLRRAEALQQTRETSKGLAVCYYKMKNHISAAEQFGNYLDEYGNDVQMKMLYADSLESLERYDEAVRLLDAIEEATAEEQKIVDARLTSMREKAKESKLHVREHSRNFHLSYRSGEHEDLVSFVMDSLERSLDSFIETYGFMAPVAPIEVVLYPADNFTVMVPGGPTWAEGLFDGRLRIPIRESMLEGQREGLLQVLKHELVHALFASMNDSRALPSWFDEGIAQLASCPDEAQCRSFSFPQTPTDFLSTTSFTTPYISFDSMKAGRAYRQSLYLIYFLRHKHGMQGIATMVRAVTPTAPLSSDSLLEPLSLTFTDLREAAADAWDSRDDLALEGY